MPPRRRRSFLGCITAEPTDLQTIVGARGASYLRIEVHGTACHAGSPGDGANAIYGAAAVVAEIERMHAELTDHPHIPCWVRRRGASARSRAATAAAWCLPNAPLFADRRILPGESAATVLDDLRARIDALRLTDRGLTVEVSMPMEMPAFETPAESPLARTVGASVADAGGPSIAARRMDGCV